MQIATIQGFKKLTFRTLALIFSSLSERIAQTLETSAFWIPVRWPIYFIHSLDKTKFSCSMNLMKRSWYHLVAMVISVGIKFLYD